MTWASCPTRQVWTRSCTSVIYHCDVSSVGQSPVESVNVFKKQNPENSAEYYVAPKTTKVLCSFEVTLIFTFQTQKKRRRESDQVPGVEIVVLTLCVCNIQSLQ